MQQDFFNKLIDKHLSGKTNGEENILLDEYYTRLGRKDPTALRAPEAEALRRSVLSSLQLRMQGVAETPVATVRPMRTRWWIAAAVMIGVVSMALFLLLKEQGPDVSTAALQKPSARVDTLFHDIRNNNHGVMDTLLPDGTHVWLNQNASIRFPDVFGAGERWVELQGEAYFDVVHIATQPFRVKAGEAEIEDIGTKFNIVYVPGKPLKVTLVEGIVRVNKVQLSEPGQQYSQGRITRVDLRRTMAWKEAFTKDSVLLFTRFPLQQEVALVSCMTIPEDRVSALFMLNDSTLVTYWYNPKPGDYFFHTYSLNTQQAKERYLRAPGPGGFMQASFSGLYQKNTFWAYDFSVQDLMVSHLNDPQEGKPPVVYHLGNFYYDLQLMEGLKVVADGAEHSMKEIQEWDLVAHKETADYGTLEPTPRGFDVTAWKDANQAHVFLKPSEDKVAIAHRTTDKVKIFDRNTRHSRLIKGPENFGPDFDQTTPYGINRKVSARNEKTRMAFVKGAATERYLFLLYSGLPDEQRYVPESKTRAAGQYVFVYDWDGNPVKKIKLDRLVTSITVSDDNHTLYANHNNADKKTIYKAKTGL